MEVYGLDLPLNRSQYDHNPDCSDNTSFHHHDPSHRGSVLCYPTIFPLGHSIPEAHQLGFDFAALPAL